MPRKKFVRGKHLKKLKEGKKAATIAASKLIKVFEATTFAIEERVKLKQKLFFKISLIVNKC